MLGAGGHSKYQRYGGQVSLTHITKVLSANGDRESLDRLLRMTVLSTAVGNLDMHAKNISLLHPLDGTMTLTPAYDIVPLAHLPNDGEMALAIDNEYRHKAITRAHLIAEGQGWGMSNAAQIVDDTLAAVLDTATTQKPHRLAHPDLAGDIAQFTGNPINGRAVGDS